MARATKRTMAKATMKRAMVTATKRAMVTDGNNTGNGYSKEGGGRSTTATMGTREGHCHSRYNWREGDDGGNEPWFLYVFWCVWRDHKK
jgi:hypothetical protein